MTKREMIAVAHEGLLLGPAPLFRHAPQGKREPREGVVLTCCGSAGPALNKVAVIGPAPPLARILELASDFFGPDSGGFGIVVEADAGHPVEEELRQAGWRVFEDEPVLTMPTIPPPQAPPSELVIKRVRDAHDRRDLAYVLAAGFGEPTADGAAAMPDDIDEFVPSVPCANDPDVALLLGYVGDQPAATACLFKVRVIAGIAGVATVPAFRRRGLATAITWAALGEAVARGCVHATLAALGPSFDLYRKMGFVHVCNHRAYEPPG